VKKASDSISDRTSSRELLVDLSGVARGRWAAELEHTLRAAIRSGRLRAGVRLPSTRALAADLGVSRGVVVQAFEQLAAEGYLVTRPGAAARVSDVAARVGSGTGVGAPAAPVGAGGVAGGRSVGVQSPAGLPGGVSGAGALVAPVRAGGVAGGRLVGMQPPARLPDGVSGARPLAAPAAGGEVDLRPGSPYLASLPRADWERAVRKALAALTDAELGYGDSRGLPRLREALADYLGRVRGAVVDPADLVVVNGFAQGLVIAARLLAGLGIAAAGVEDPGSIHTTAHLAAQGILPVPVPVDDEGVDLDRAGPQAAGLRALLATPAHQFPTGAVLSPARRLRLVEWAERNDGLVVEDDYDAEYRYDHHPVGALQGMAPDRVVLGGSTSKTLAPGLRLGWLAVPSALAGDAALHKRGIDLMAPVLEQAALAELIVSGNYERHIRRSRSRYRRRRDLVVDLVADRLPEAAVGGTSAGLHLVVETPSIADEAAVEAEAARRGVLVVGLGAHRHAPGPPGFVLGYGHLSEDQLRRGVTGLAAAVRACELH
jgi:GntR family transcriptional regulator/MocR family aminotransferase